ncbi:hypothetical protein M433DRAFT_8896 [Acidomyces richmondensis BFW]|nr:MAG: hypothetical protein FE78DRAFT_32349 [Acidomyces sp. 'richmondensis']KYG40366.1 hypothetical protein M433DRAFT_8896 [Acidomyces richmondensis BFW]
MGRAAASAFALMQRSHTASPTMTTTTTTSAAGCGAVFVFLCAARDHPAAIQWDEGASKTIKPALWDAGTFQQVDRVGRERENAVFGAWCSPPVDNDLPDDGASGQLEKVMGSR